MILGIPPARALMGFDPQLRTDVEDKSLKGFTPTAAQHIGEMQEQ